MSKLTQGELKRLINYDPETGIFAWLVDSPTRKVGDTAGCISKVTGYRSIKINRISHRANRLAWLYMEGYWPEYDIDHENGVRDDDRWVNLRHTTKPCNLQNQKIYKNNKSGFPGVIWKKNQGKWESCVRINKIKIHLGHHDSPIDAALARFTFVQQCDKWSCDARNFLLLAIKEHWPEFNPNGG